MRKLLYIPIIHVDADLGSIALSVNRKSLEICGKERWVRHKEIVGIYWERIRNYFKGVDSQGLEIYQDGLLAEGKLGRRIIEEGARRGSSNHQIVLDLITRGAKIRKTEDVDLLKKEFHRLLKLAEADPELEEGKGILQRAEGERLMVERDRFVADTINQTLTEGGRGALFMGAFHNVLADLADDIEIRELKRSNKVREYFESVIFGSDEGTFDRLASFMVSDLPLTSPPKLN